MRTSFRYLQKVCLKALTKSTFVNAVFSPVFNAIFELTPDIRVVVDNVDRRSRSTLTQRAPPICFYDFSIDENELPPFTLSSFPDLRIPAFPLCGFQFSPNRA